VTAAERFKRITAAINVNGATLETVFHNHPKARNKIRQENEMLNVELLRLVADKIEAEPDNYKQASYVCKTAHCIGGWSAVLWGTGEPNFENGMKALNLSITDAHILFASDWKPKEGATPAQALRLFADGYSLQEVSDRYGFDRYGFDRDGRDRDGFDRYGRTKPE
jgi:hypothetical protein